MSTTSVPDLGAVIEAAELFIEMGVPIIPVNPGTSKRPVPSKRSGWQIFTEKDSVRKSFEQIASSRGSVNLGIMKQCGTPNILHCGGIPVTPE